MKWILSFCLLILPLSVFAANSDDVAKTSKEIENSYSTDAESDKTFGVANEEPCVDCKLVNQAQRAVLDNRPKGKTMELANKLLGDKTIERLPTTTPTDK